MSLSIEQFRKLDKEGIRSYGKTLRLGRTYDENNNLLSNKITDDQWYLYTYNSENKILTEISSLGFWKISTYDKDGFLLKRQLGDDFIRHGSKNKGSLIEKTFNKNGIRIGYKDSEGYYAINQSKVVKEEYDSFINKVYEKRSN